MHLYREHTEKEKEEMEARQKRNNSIGEQIKKIVGKKVIFTTNPYSSDYSIAIDTEYQGRILLTYDTKDKKITKVFGPFISDTEIAKIKSIIETSIPVSGGRRKTRKSKKTRRGRKHTRKH